MQIRSLTQDHDSTDDRDDDIHDVADVAQRRHEDVSVDVGLLGGIEELGVVGEEVLLRCLLVVEDLHDLLAVHHLFDVALLVGQGLLLSAHEAPRKTAQLSGERGHEGADDEHDQGKPHGVVQHRRDENHDREAGLDEGGDRLADELADGVRVVGEGRHDRPVRMGIEEAQREAFHRVEHVVAHVLESPLGDDRHRARVDEASEDADAEDDAHREHEAHQGGAHRVKSALQAGGHDRVDDSLHEDRSHSGGNSSQDDAYDRQTDAHRVMTDDVAHQPREGMLDALELLAVRARSTHAGHVRPPRFPWLRSENRRSRGIPRLPPSVRRGCLVP